MLGRRAFIKGISIMFFPFSSAYACSGGATGNLPQSVTLNQLPLKNKTLSEFLNAKLGHQNWQLDTQNNVHITNLNSKYRPNYLVPESLSNFISTVDITSKYKGLNCSSLSIYIEKSIPVIKTYIEKAGINKFIAREKIATYSFPTPGLITKLSFKTGVDSPARFIFITTYIDPKNTERSYTLVTVSPKIYGYCYTRRELVPSISYAENSCDKMRNRDWSSHVDVNHIVDNCKASIKVEE